MSDIAAMTPGELGEVAAFVNDGWRAAYAGVLDDEFLANLTTDDQAARIRRHLDMGVRAWVVRDTRLAGMAMAGPSLEEFFESDGELDMIYVRPDLIGAGMGHELFAHACRHLVEAGFGAVVLDIFVGNERAMRFYRRHGLRVVRHTGIEMAGRRYPLDIMRGRLVAESHA